MNKKVIPVGFVVVGLSLILWYYFQNRESQQSRTTQDTQSTTQLTPAISSKDIRSPVCDCSWSISGSLNVEFLVTNPSGKQTGYLQASNTYVNNIPDASYGPDAGFLYFGQNKPENGVYTVKVFAKQPGDYSLDVGIVYGPMNSKVVPISGAFVTKQVDEYTIELPEGLVNMINN